VYDSLWLCEGLGRRATPARPWPVQRSGCAICSGVIPACVASGRRVLFDLVAQQLCAIYETPDAVVD